MNFSFWHIFKLGGPVMWLLLATSITALAFIIERFFIFIQWRQNFELVIETLGPLFTAGEWRKAEQWCRHHKGPFTRFVSVYLQHRTQPKEVRDDLLRREGLLIIGHLDKNLRILAMISQISTLLGLLGTFHVMIMRFSQAHVAGSQSANFSSAVWEALLTTMYGLLIAVPCSAIYQVLEGRVDNTARQLDILLSYLDEWRSEAEDREKQLSHQEKTSGWDPRPGYTSETEWPENKSILEDHRSIPWLLGRNPIINK